jgi:serine/threonine protein kinase
MTGAAGPPWLSDGVLSHLRAVTRAAGEASGAPPAVSRYELLELLGQGGMGAVYLARDRTLGREVALKVVTPAASAGEGADSELRLLAEARILAGLEHPGLVPVHDLGTLPDGRVFYAMKRVQGCRLDAYARDRLAGGRLDLLRVFERICEAVAFAHARGVIHRDLKPENVMVGPFGEVLVLDWGLARLQPAPAPGAAPAAGVAGAVARQLDARAEAGPAPPPPPEARGGAPAPPPVPDGLPDEPLTLPGEVVGTPGYMAPEQRRGAAAEVDERSDVFALGAILRYLLTGSPAAAEEAALEHRTAPAAARSGAGPATVLALPPPASRPPVPLQPPVPKALAAICRQAMAPEPQRRYPGAADLAADLARFLAGLPVAAYPENPLRRAVRLARRHATPLLLLLAYLLMRLLLLYFARRP